MNSQEYTDAGTAERITLRFMAAPTDVNWGGKVHGGIVMKWIDEAAYVCASRYCGMDAVAVFSGGVRFYRPLLIGHVVEVEARLVYTGTKGMHVAVHVRSGDREHVRGTEDRRNGRRRVRARRQAPRLHWPDRPQIHAHEPHSALQPPLIRLGGEVVPRVVCWTAHCDPTGAAFSLSRTTRSRSWKGCLEKPVPGLFAGGEKPCGTRECPTCHSEVGNDTIEWA
jgi:acyl-CoA hydrolase